MNNLEKYLNDDPLYIRLRELALYFKKNKGFLTLQKTLNKAKKELVSAKISQDLEKIKLKQDAYDLLEKELLDLPFVEEYMSLLEVFKDYLKILEKDISAFITSDLTFI